MIRIILLILLVLMILGGENIVVFSSVENSWVITINHQELISSFYNGAVVIYDFIGELIGGDKPIQV